MRGPYAGAAFNRPPRSFSTGGGQSFNLPRDVPSNPSCLPLPTLPPSRYPLLHFRQVKRVKIEPITRADASADKGGESKDDAEER
jgi:hypothetical protein